MLIILTKSLDLLPRLASWRHIVIGVQEFAFQQAKVASVASTGRLGSYKEATQQVHRTVHWYRTVTCCYGTRIVRTMERMCRTAKPCQAHTAGWRILMWTNNKAKRATTQMSGKHGSLAHPHIDKDTVEASNNKIVWQTWRAGASS